MGDRDVAMAKEDEQEQAEEARTSKTMDWEKWVLGLFPFVHAPARPLGGVARMPLLAPWLEVQNWGSRDKSSYKEHIYK